MSRYSGTGLHANNELVSNCTAETVSGIQYRKLCKLYTNYDGSKIFKLYHSYSFELEKAFDIYARKFNLQSKIESNIR